MARKRMIDPHIWEDPGFNSLSLSARLLFIGMISNADDKGYLRADAGSLKRLVFGFDEIKKDEVEIWAKEILDLPTIHSYEVNNERFAHFLKWDTYQKQQKDRIQESVYPVCSKCLTNDKHPLTEVKVSKEKLSKDNINIGKASPKFKKLEEDKKQLTQKLSLGGQVSSSFQEKALRYATYLHLNLKNPSLRSRWFDFFKRNQNSAVDVTISNVKDAPTFLSLVNEIEKIKYFFGVYYGKLKPS